MDTKTIGFPWQEPLPEKVLKIFEAVEQFAKEGRDVTTLKVSEISAKAGIGKGTTYEYFESREEMISKAVLFSISKNIKVALEILNSKDDFKTVFYKICDYIWNSWVDDSVKKQILEFLTNYGGSAGGRENVKLYHGEQVPECLEVISDALDKYIGRGIDEGILKHGGIKYAREIFCSQIFQYMFILESKPEKSEKQAIEDFVYEGLTILLNR